MDVKMKKKMKKLADKQDIKLSIICENKATNKGLDI